MKNMKKLGLVFIIVLACAICLCGCSKDEKPYDYDLKEYITLGSYPNVEVDIEEINDAVNDEIEKITSQYKETKDTDRTEVKDSDTVNIDYVGKVDGKEFEGGSASGTDLKIGSNSFIDGFEKGLIGHSVGQTVDLNLTFPDDYKNTEVAGKPVIFTVTINSLKEEFIPELTDEMVKEKTEFETVDEYIEDTRKAKAEEALWTAFVESCKVEKYPEKETRQYYNNIITNINQMAVYNGMTLEKIVTSFYGYNTLEAFYQYALDSAKTAVKENMAVWATVREFDISLTDEEYEKEALELAEAQNIKTVEEYEDAVGETVIKVQIYTDKIKDKLFNEANLDFDAIEDNKDETTGESEETKSPESEETSDETKKETTEE